MPNNFFRFKHFTIYQDKCAMKVCTDACLFGAYLAEEILEKKYLSNVSCLDIGTGTGLLSLMIAQKNNIIIDAVELDEDAFLQAKENIEQSIFREKINIFHENILHYNSGEKYDIIICNPPFYENELASIAENDKIAKHSTHLTLKDLLICIEKLLNQHGFFSVLLPYHRLDYFENLAFDSGFHIYKKILIKHSPTHPYFRGILFFLSDKQEAVIEEIVIKNSSQDYTQDFLSLINDYYL